MRVLLLALLALQGPPRTGVIEGVVIRARVEPIAPLVNTRVVLARGAEEVIARTDSNGRFQFYGLPPGQYRLRVTKDGFLRQEYPGVAMGATGLPIDLVSGQELRNIVFRLELAPTIAGVIRDARNSPIANVTVQALRRGYDTRGNRTLTLLSTARTDDRGAYRLYWLDPGEYFIAAAPPQITGTTSPSRGPVALATTYFPGFGAIDDAKAVRVEPGRVANGIDFALTQVPLGPVRGAVTSLSTGRYAEAAVVLSAPEDGPGIARFQARSVASPPPFSRENYSIPSVPPGVYIATAAGRNEQASKRILVRGSGLVVDLVLGPGLGIRGQLRGISEIGNDLRAVRIALEEEDTALPSPPSVSVAPDGTFLVPAVQPGHYSVNVSGLSGDAYVRSASFGGTNVLEKPFPVEYGGIGDQDALNIQVSADGGRISGTVLNQENLPFVGAQVTLVPEGENQSRLDCYRVTFSVADGTFVLRGIVPGDYRLFGWEGLEPNAHLNAEFIRAYRDLGTRLRVEPGQSGSVSLRLIPIDP